MTCFQRPLLSKHNAINLSSIQKKPRILLPADEAKSSPGRSDGQIIDALGVSKNPICRARERFVEEGLESALVRKPTARTYAPSPMVGAMRT